MKFKRAEYHAAETPSYLLGRQTFLNTYSAFERAWRIYPSPVSIAFSFKTCNAVEVLQSAYRHGLLAEVVSVEEYRLAREIGYEPCRIIYNGPAKSCPTFIEAVLGGAIVNIETQRELEWLAALPVPDTGRHYNVGIRISVNLSHIAPREAEGPDDYSRFGFDTGNGNFAAALRYLSGLSHVRLSGLHLHRTIRSRRVDFYRRLVRYAAGIIREYNLDLQYLDLGGGYHEPTPGAPSFTDYAAAVSQELADAGQSHITLILEPGNALTANAIQYVCQVIDIKCTGDRYVVTVDGSRKDVDPLYRRSALKYKIIRNKGLEKQQTAPYPVQIVCGATCMEYDKLLTISDKPLLRVGDRIVIEHAGAYTYSLSPDFIISRPRVVIL